MRRGRCCRPPSPSKVQHSRAARSVPRSEPPAASPGRRALRSRSRRPLRTFQRARSRRSVAWSASSRRPPTAARKWKWHTSSGVGDVRQAATALAMALPRSRTKASGGPKSSSVACWARSMRSAGQPGAPAFRRSSLSSAQPPLFPRPSQARIGRSRRGCRTARREGSGPAGGGPAGPGWQRGGG